MLAARCPDFGPPLTTTAASHSPLRRRPHGSLLVAVAADLACLKLNALEPFAPRLTANNCVIRTPQRSGSGSFRPAPLFQNLLEPTQ